MEDNSSRKDLAFFLALFMVFVSYALALLLFGTSRLSLTFLFIVFIIAPLVAGCFKIRKNLSPDLSVFPWLLAGVFCISAFLFVIESIPHMAVISCETASPACIMNGLIDCGITLLWPVLAFVSICALYLYSVVRRN